MVKNKSNPERCKLVWQKTNGVCAHCGRQASSKSRTVDHYIPRSWGSGYDIRNLLPLCYECNQSKDNSKVYPATYYKYASREAIAQCLAFEKEFKAKRRSMSGEEW